MERGSGGGICRPRTTRRDLVPGRRRAALHERDLRRAREGAYPHVHHGRQRAASRVYARRDEALRGVAETEDAIDHAENGASTSRAISGMIIEPIDDGIWPVHLEVESTNQRLVCTGKLSRPISSRPSTTTLDPCLVLARSLA